MTVSSPRPRRTLPLLVALTLLPAAATLAQERFEPTQPLAPFAWTLKEAERQLQLTPRDPYLQYVTVQLAAQDGKGDRYAREIQSNLGAAGRRNDISLFSTFTGALAVQESLQLDTMRERPRNSGGETTQELIPITDLEGPTIKSHPWKEMLAGRDPEVSPLSKCVPADFYYVRFKRIAKLMELIDRGNLWSRHLLDQSLQQAHTSRSSEVLQQQLCVETSDLLKPFYDLAVSEVAAAGSDLYVREGSDLTLLFSVKQRLLFDERMQHFLSQAQANVPGVRREEGSYRGVKFVHLTAPHRVVHVFAADPRPDLHIRSNSRAAFEMIVDAILGKRVTGEPVESLGQTDEFRFIRTLMPLNADEEDGFVYLSDPFIRRMVGPEVKITELRRMEAYNQLRMIGHGCLLYRTQYGRRPESLAALHEHGCGPDFASDERFTSPGGFGEHQLEEGRLAVNTHYGSVDRLRPILEIPVQYVTHEEAEQYRQFRERYDQYWRVFFDPIAIRVKLAPKQYRVETIVLPLIDNSIYTSMAAALGGETEALDALPVPAGNIFTLNAKLKDRSFGPAMMRELESEIEWDARELLPREDADAAKRVAERFFEKGMGNQVGFHVYDDSPLFSLSLPMVFREFTRPRGNTFANPDSLLWSFLLGSLNSPVYISAPVNDIEATDDFLRLLEDRLALYSRRPRRAGWFSLEPDFYRIEEPGKPVIACQTLKFGPLKWRMFWARIDNAIYVASKRFILDDIAAAHAAAREQPAADQGPSAHAMVRLRADHWKQALPEFELGWAENNRAASLNNISPIYGVARALLSEASREDGVAEKLDLTKISQAAHDEANDIYGVHYFCPDGGEYRLVAAGRDMENTLHGRTLAPRQGSAPAKGVATTELLSEFRQATAALTFEEDGLRAVLTIDRK